MARNKLTKRDPLMLTEEDVRWVEIVRRSLDGLAAIAEANAEGLETEWCAMHYSLLSVREIVDDIIEDMRNRMEGAYDGK